MNKSDTTALCEDACNTVSQEDDFFIKAVFVDLEYFASLDIDEERIPGRQTKLRNDLGLSFNLEPDNNGNLFFIHKDFMPKIDGWKDMLEVVEYGLNESKQYAGTVFVMTGEKECKESPLDKVYLSLKDLRQEHPDVKNKDVKTIYYEFVRLREPQSAQEEQAFNRHALGSMVGDDLYEKLFDYCERQIDYYNHFPDEFEVLDKNGDLAYSLSELEIMRILGREASDALYGKMNRSADLYL